MRRKTKTFFLFRYCIVIARCKWLHVDHFTFLDNTFMLCKTKVFDLKRKKEKKSSF